MQPWTGIAAAAWLGLVTAFPAEAKPGKPPAYDPKELRSVDEHVRLSIAAASPKTSSKIQSAFQALQKGNLSRARALARQIPADLEFGDYRFYLFGLADLEEAQKKLKTRGRAEAERLARTALSHLGRALRITPYSAIEPQIGLAIAQAQFTLGNALWTPKRKSLQEAALLEMGAGFQWYYSTRSSEKIPLSQIEMFSKSCKERPDPICLGWIRRFLSAFYRNTIEKKTVAKEFPELPDPPKNQAVGSKSFQSYKQPDLDKEKFGKILDLALEDEKRSALSEIEEFIEKFPNSELGARTQFWKARLLWERDKKEEAEPVYQKIRAQGPLGFYSVVAALDLGKKIDDPLQKTEPKVLAWDDSLLPNEQFRLKRALAFLKTQDLDRASWELSGLRTRNTMASEFIRYLAAISSQAGAHLTAFIAASELIDRGTEYASSQGLADLIFPVAYWELIQKHAKNTGLDPILVLSLIKQESAFQADIVSPSGAQGLMQLMPFTAADVDPSVERANLAVMDTNIRLGTTYLAKVIERMDGNVAAALAGYNAGPEKARGWLKEFGHGGLLLFIDKIPYRETQNYVASIIRNYFWYSRKLGKEQPQSLEMFWPKPKNGKK